MKPITAVTCLLLTLLLSCDRPECTNTNPVFERNPAGSEAYKRELAAQLQKPGNGRLRYWFDRYEKGADAEHILVYVQGGGLCAEVHVLVNDWPEQIKGLRGGNGYHGAELDGFKMHIRQDAEHTEFVYRGLDGIAD